MKFEIMMSILFELLAKKHVSAKYLSDKYGVSRRSIYRYVENLEFAGVPVYRIRGNGGGFSLVDTYRLSSTFLTSDEFSAVTNAIAGICAELPDHNLENALLKIKATRKNEYSGFDVRSGNLVIDGGPWGDTRGYKCKLNVLSRCANENFVLHIRYHDRNGTVTERDIEPHVIVFKQGQWYVYSFCRLRNQFRFFKTGRIEQAIILKEKFTRKEINSGELPFEKFFDTSEAKDVVFEVYESKRSDVEEWLGVENVFNEDGKTIARASLPFDDGLVMKIMGYGNGIKVISPSVLKEKIVCQANEIINNYKKYNG